VRIKTATAVTVAFSVAGLRQLPLPLLRQRIFFHPDFSLLQKVLAFCKLHAKLQIALQNRPHPFDIPQ
jgi:hypothetical protein